MLYLLLLKNFVYLIKLLWAKIDNEEKHAFNYELIKNGNWCEDFIKKPEKQMRSIWAIGTPESHEK